MAAAKSDPYPYLDAMREIARRHKAKAIDVETAYVIAVVDECGGNLQAAGKVLGSSRGKVDRHLRHAGVRIVKTVAPGGAPK